MKLFRSKISQEIFYNVEIPTGKLGDFHFHFGTRIRPSTKTMVGAGNFSKFSF